MNPADIIRIKDLLPTAMGSDELREQVAADILRRSVFSARMESARYLAQMREVCAQMMEGRISQATARDMLGGILDRMGFSPQDGGSVRNPASLARLKALPPETKVVCGHGPSTTIGRELLANPFFC